jgi:hypothetical protein
MRCLLISLIRKKYQPIRRRGQPFWVRGRDKGVHRGLMFHARKMGQPRSRILWRLSP